MPFEVLNVREEDCAAVADMDELATRGWPLGLAMDLEAQRQGKSRKRMIEGMMLHNFKEPSPNVALIKVVDSDTGVLVSVAMWSWQLEEAKEKVEVDAPVPEEAAVAEAKDERRTILSTLRKEMEEVRKESYGNQPHFSMSSLSSSLCGRLH